jgi:hypothetical protein
VTEGPPYEIRPYATGDEEGILDLWNRVFGAGRADFRPRTLEEWRWRFLENPAGTRIFVAVEGAGKVVAQYASIPVRTLLEGREAIFGQIVDSMVDPAHRRGLGRPGLFVRTAEPFFDAFGSPDRDVVMYGYPIQIAWRVGSAFLRYEVVRTDVLLFRPPGVAGGALDVDVEEVATFGAEADALWKDVAPSFAASTVRDGRFLDWRFGRRPGAYRRGIARRGGRAAGLAVVRVAPFIVERAAAICEWLVPPGDLDAARALLAWASEIARDGRAPIVGTLLPDASPWFVPFQREGFRVAPTDYFMVARHFDSRYDMDWLRRNWLYTLADTDLL